MHRISPCIWYNLEALAAAQLYVSVFENSKIEYWSQYIEGDGWPTDLPPETPLNVRFTLCGQEFNAVNGGPIFRPNPAISYFVDCESETQLDMLWKKLGDGGEVLMEVAAYPFSPKFGWLNDRYGVSWQLSLSGQKQKITPYLLFAGACHGKAEEAMNTWCALFGNAGILGIQHYGKDAPDTEPEGSVMYATFQLEGQPFMAADSGYPHNFGFTEGNSFIIYCANQAEIDTLWAKLTEGGQEQPCGWLKDRFGVSWQVVPEEMEKLGDTTNHAQANRVNAALIKMKKIDLQTLRDAYAGI